jgi:hypothetical protein
MAFADITGTLSTPLVTAVPGKSVKLIGYAISNDLTISTGFYFASSGGLKLTATHTLGNPGAFGRAASDGVKCTTLVGEGLNLVQTAAGNLGIDYEFSIS